MPRPRRASAPPRAPRWWRELAEAKRTRQQLDRRWVRPRRAPRAPGAHVRRARVPRSRRPRPPAHALHAPRRRAPRPPWRRNSRQPSPHQALSASPRPAVVWPRLRLPRCRRSRSASRGPPVVAPAAPSTCRPGRAAVSPVAADPDGVRCSSASRPPQPPRTDRPPYWAPRNAFWPSRVLRVGAVRLGDQAGQRGEVLGRDPGGLLGAGPAPGLDARQQLLPLSRGLGGVGPPSTAGRSRRRRGSGAPGAWRSGQGARPQLPEVAAPRGRRQQAHPTRRACGRRSPPAPPVVPEGATRRRQDEFRLAAPPAPPSRRPAGAARSRGRAISAVRVPRTAPTRRRRPPRWPRRRGAEPRQNGSGVRRSATVQKRRASGGRRDARAANRARQHDLGAPPRQGGHRSTCPSPSQSAYSTSPPATTPSGSKSQAPPRPRPPPPRAGAGPPPGRIPARSRPGQP